jgi:hypothetical protein
MPDPVAEEGPVKGKSTQGSDDEDRDQRPYRLSHAFDGSPLNRHPLLVLMLWAHKAPLCRPSYAVGAGGAGSLLLLGAPGNNGMT